MVEIEHIIFVVGITFSWFTLIRELSWTNYPLRCTCKNNNASRIWVSWINVRWVFSISKHWKRWLMYIFRFPKMFHLASQKKKHENKCTFKKVHIVYTLHHIILQLVLKKQSEESTQVRDPPWLWNQSQTSPDAIAVPQQGFKSLKIVK